MGLVRLSNLAISKAIAKGDFESRAHTVLSEKPELRAHIAWGDASELADSAALTEIVGRLQGEFGNRIDTTILPGQKHALANDVILQGALVTEALRY